MSAFIAVHTFPNQGLPRSGRPGSVSRQRRALRYPYTYQGNRYSVFRGFSMHKSRCPCTEESSIIAIVLDVDKEAVPICM